MGKGRCSANDEESGLGHVSNIEPRRLADGVNIGCKRKKKRSQGWYPGSCPEQLKELICGEDYL